MEIGNWRHICVDVQRLFLEDTPWHVPWMGNILPQVLEVSGRHPDKTYFTRFIPPSSAAHAVGAWKDYYRKWWMMTGEHLPVELLDLPTELRRLIPPAKVFDKKIYSPWLKGNIPAICDGRM